MKYYSIREDIHSAAIWKLDSNIYKVFSLIYAEYQLKGKMVLLTYDDIQKRTELSRGSVANSIKNLVCKGYVTRI